MAMAEHKPVLCAECQESGTKSRVYPPPGRIVTAMASYPYYDEEGRYHNHDPNGWTEEWSCSRGHRWLRSGAGRCWCGWGEEPQVRRLEPLPEIETVKWAIQADGITSLRPMAADPDRPATGEG